MRRIWIVVAVSSAVLAGLALGIALRPPDGDRFSATGELGPYEAARQDLTLRTMAGDRHFVVREATPVHEGARTIPVKELRTASGCPAKIWYRGAQGRPVARDIRISCPAGRGRNEPREGRTPR
jgi:hypothetical protein